MAAKNSDGKILEIPQGEKPLFDEIIGTVRLTAYADINEIYEDYRRKLLYIRGIPQDPNTINPSDPMIGWLSEQPEITSMPNSNGTDREYRNRAILQELVMYYEKANDSARSDAMVLAMTIDNEFTAEPVSYPEMLPGRKRPGMMQMPEIKYNLQNPLERRLKQALDQIVSIPGGLAALTERMQLMSVQMGVTGKDKDGFQS